MCFESPDVAFYKYYYFILMTRFLLLIFYFTLSLHFTPSLQSAVCILPSVCILPLVCSLQSAFYTDRILSESCSSQCVDGRNFGDGESCIADQFR